MAYFQFPNLTFSNLFAIHRVYESRPLTFLIYIRINVAEVCEKQIPEPDLEIVDSRNISGL